MDYTARSFSDFGITVQLCLTDTEAYTLFNSSNENYFCISGTIKFESSLSGVLFVAETLQ